MCCLLVVCCLFLSLPACRRSGYGVCSFEDEDGEQSVGALLVHPVLLASAPAPRHLARIHLAHRAWASELACASVSLLQLALSS
jgi:hypothetical protein